MAFEPLTGLYYLLFSLVLTLIAPYLLLFKKTRTGITQKLGFIPANTLATVKKLSGQGLRVWFHAVSVGEFNALWPLVEKFQKEHPQARIFISTTTATGQELARSRAGHNAVVFYFPLDLPFAINNWLNLLRPDLVAIVETEIWPGFMAECRKRNIKVVLINGRLSPRAFKNYMRCRWFFAPVVSRFTALAVQSEEEKERFRTLSGDNIAVTVCGNIKLDGLEPADANQIEDLRASLNLRADELVVVAGSTHEGEESALLSALKSLDGRFRLILAPRHPERFDRALELIESHGFRARLFSRQEGFASGHDVYLLDTIGQLHKFYGLADIAFVGGTLANVGGHNLAEPCVYKAPVICGPHVYKTRDLFQRLLEREALLMVQDEKDLISTLQMLLDSPGKRKQLGENGYGFLWSSQGALAKTLELLEKYLNKSGTSYDVKVETPGGVSR